MKAALLLAFLVVGQTLAVPQFTTVHNFLPTSELKDYKLCNFCVQFTGQALNELLNIVLNAGVIGGCTDICGALENKTKSEILGAACDVVCAYIGIKEFINLIEKADLDPIYFCELADLCEIKDDGDAKILTLSVVPPKVVYGSNFDIEMQFQTVNGTGTGEIDMEINTVDGIPLGENQFMLPQAPGTYGIKWSGTAAPDPDCDPTQGPCEMWLPGNYTVIVAVCNGECGSSHPHSEIYDKAQANFVVVKN